MTEQQKAVDVTGVGSSDLLCRDPRAEFERLLTQLGDTTKWTIGEKATYYGFFLHGWYGRTNQAEYQRATERHNR